MKRASSTGESRSTSKVSKSEGGNGNGHGTARAARQEKEEKLVGQPSIIELFGSRADAGQLSKTQLLTALMALKKGDFTTRLALDLSGMDGKIADAFNEVVELNQRMAEELERLSRVVGKEGKIAERAEMGD